MRTPPAVGYLRSVARIAAREWRNRRSPDAFRRERISLESGWLRADPRRVERYLDVTGGESIARCRGTDALLPPLFPAIWEAGLALELLADERAPSLAGGVVHLESELLLVRPLLAAGAARCRLELEGAEREPRGIRLRLLSRTCNDLDQLCTESRTVLLVRSREAPQERRERQAPAADDAAAAGDAAEWNEIARWRLGGGHGRRYARVSGDYNPIHLSRLTALPFGYRRPVLHGFCTASLALHALIRRCGGDPAVLRRFRVVFHRPLLLPAQVRLQLSAATGPTRFRVMDEKERLVADGEAVGCA